MSKISVECSLEFLLNVLSKNKHIDLTDIEKANDTTIGEISDASYGVWKDAYVAEEYSSGYEKYKNIASDLKESVNLILDFINATMCEKKALISNAKRKFGGTKMNHVLSYFKGKKEDAHDIDIFVNSSSASAF